MRTSRAAVRSPTRIRSRRNSRGRAAVKLINYTSAKGDKLQGALYLPANYEPGRSTHCWSRSTRSARISRIRTSRRMKRSTPNRSIYTSRGYAVLDPDIVYKINDPGMSACGASSRR
jgi:hypothetical protein